MTKSRAHMDPESQLSAPLTIAVLMGGASDEREVSLKTGAGVSSALRQRGHRVLDVEIQSDGLTWKCAGDIGSPVGLIPKVLADVDVYFLALHGGDGEGGALQGLFKSLGLVHTGSQVSASALCMDKLQSLRFLRGAGLRTAPHCNFTFEEYALDKPACLAAARGLPDSQHGLSVKPRSGGSSVATFLLSPEEAMGEPLGAALAAVFAVGDTPLVESRLVGVEVTCPVLEDANSIPQALAPVEISPKEGRFFDYEEKYSADGAAEYCPPRSLDDDQQASLRSLALRAHLASGCSGYSRVDFIVPTQERDKTPFLLEINTLPGMTERSLFPLSAREAGMDFGVLCERICASAMAARAQ